MMGKINQYFDSAFARAEREYLTPPEPKAAIYCDECGEGISFDETYYLVGGVVYCESCMDGMRRTVND